MPKYEVSWPAIYDCTATVEADDEEMAIEKALEEEDPEDETYRTAWGTAGSDVGTPTATLVEE